MKIQRLSRPLLLAISFSTTTSAGDTWTVCPSGCDFTTVQAAVGAAQSGDVITVKAGRYLLDSTIETDGKAITVHGELDEHGQPATYLDGRGTRRVLRCQDGEGLGTVFRDLAFVNGESSAGAGIRVDHSGPRFINWSDDFFVRTSSKRQS